MRKPFAAAIAAIAMASAAVTPVQAQAANFASQSLVFDVLMNGDSIGTHSIRVAPSGGATTVSVNVALAVKVGPVTAWSYSHRCTENWAGTQLSGLTCTTRKDGRNLTVNATSAGSGLNVRASGYNGAAPATVIPSSWWNAAFLRNGRVINSETGALETMRVTNLGADSVTIGSRTVSATKYRVAGSITANVWYDGNNRLVKIAFTARGRDVVYRLRG
jgi:hypothetical protein